jgi:glycosyltransferase involved in cell wall biosynthesis
MGYARAIYMKVCVVSQSYYPYIGGVTKYLQALGGKLLARGDEMIVVHLKAPDMPEFEVIDGVRIYRMAGDEGMQDTMGGYFKFKELIIDATHGRPAPPIEDRFNQGYYEYLGFNLSMYEKVRQVYAAEKFDVLHVHDFQVMPLAFLIRGDVDVPTIFTWHIPFTEATPFEWRDFLVRYMRYYDKVIFSTDEYLRTALQSGMDPERAVRINPFIDTAKYFVEGENDFREKYGIRPQDNVVLCVSRIDPRKGQEYLIKAMAEVVKKHPHTTCLFIGNGSLTKKFAGRENRLEELESLVRELGLGDNVRFLGKVGQEDLMKAFGACDMLVQPSINEGFGLVISEAMCFGKPVIGSNVGGIPEQIRDGVNGLLFKACDHLELAAHIDTLLDSPEMRMRMGEEGRKIVNERFGVDRGFREHCDIYDNIYLQKRLKERPGTGESLLTG